MRARSANCIREDGHENSQVGNSHVELDGGRALQSLSLAAGEIG